MPPNPTVPVPRLANSVAVALLRLVDAEAIEAELARAVEAAMASGEQYAPLQVLDDNAACGIADLARSLLVVRRARQQASAAEALIEQSLAVLMPAGVWFVDTVGRLERKKRGKNTTWDDEPLARKLLEANWDEIGHPNDVVALLLECAAVSYWRLQALEKRGVNGYEHRAQEDAGYRVVIVEDADQ